MCVLTRTPAAAGGSENKHPFPLFARSLMVGQVCFLSGVSGRGGLGGLPTLGDAECRGVAVIPAFAPDIFVPGLKTLSGYFGLWILGVREFDPTAQACSYF